MDRKEEINLALTLFRQEFVDRNERNYINKIQHSRITAYRYAKKALDQYEWEMDKEESPIKSFGT